MPRLPSTNRTRCGPRIKVRRNKEPEKYDDEDEDMDVISIVDDLAEDLISDEYLGSIYEMLLQKQNESGPPAEDLFVDMSEFDM